MTQAHSRSRIAVVGGGVCGLALAHRLLVLGERNLALFEAAPQAGGHASTVVEDGFLVEAGPNGFLDRSAGPIDMAEDLGIADALIEARPAAKKRFILRGGRLRRAPDSPPLLLTSDALSLSGKLRLLMEPFAPGPPAGVEETVYEFARRRIGTEAADALVDAMVSGISAGDSKLISLAAAFPMMEEMEREHGSLIRAMMARRKQGLGPPRLLAFQGGMVQLVDAAARALGPVLRTGTRVERIEPLSEGAGFRLTLPGGTTHEAAQVALALPARAAATVVRGLDGELADALAETHYSSVAVVGLAYRASDLKAPLDGYGYLVTRGEGQVSLGVVWESSLFDDRAPAGMVLLRAILGGPRHPEIATAPEAERVAVARAEIERVLGITAAPERTWTFAWPHAIAQYLKGHRARVARARALAARHPGLTLCGTSYDGIAFGAAVDAGRAHAQTLIPQEAVPV